MQFLIPLPVLLSMNNIKKCHVRQPQTHESIKKLLYLIRVFVKLELFAMFLSVCVAVSLGGRLYPWTICVHCASEEVTDCTASQFLPQCQECISQGLDRVNRPKKNRNLCVLLCFVYMCLCAFVSDISIIIF